VVDNPEAPAKDKLTAAFKILEFCKMLAMGFSIESNNPENLQKQYLK